MVFILHYSQQYFNITFPLKLKADSWDLSRYSPQNEDITHEDVTFLCGGVPGDSNKRYLAIKVVTKS